MILTSTHYLLPILFMVISWDLIAQDTETIYLTGKGFEDAIEWDFFCSAGRKSGSWQKIAVPSCWEQEGFGEYNYGHDPFEKRVNEMGHYKRTFLAGSAWKGKNIQLVFDGVMTDAEVFVNGKSAGPRHRGAFYQFRYELSNLIKFDSENILEVKVYKHSDNESVNQAERNADYWIFGGIFRPVYLEVKPKEHIERTAIDARADGSFRSHVYTSKLKAADKILAVLLDDESREVTSFESKIVEDTEKQEITGELKSPNLWSPEFPNLYTAQFKLVDKNGKVLHQILERVGFRTVEVREADGIYVNDVKIKFKGVNRHSFHPDHGRTSSKSFSIEAVELIKDMNMNAVRMSHYLPDGHFLDVCDSLGLFVLDELAGWQKPSYDDVIGRKLLEEMIHRDVNHPSVVIWDNGNEGGWNTSYDDAFADLDIQKREVIHPWESFRKTNTRHYIDYNFLSGNNFDQRGILFPTELLHGLYDGGHGAGLEDFWSIMWNDPLCAGGFLWVFADETVKRTDTGQLDSDGNHAPDGILGPYNEKEGSFYTIREIWAPVHFETKIITPSFDGVFNIQNRYHYTDLDQCTFVYEWVKLPDPEKGQNQILATGSPEVGDLDPGDWGQLRIPVNDIRQQADVLYIKAAGPDGRHINTWSWAVKTPYVVGGSLVNTTDVSPAARTDNNGDIILKRGDVEVIINGKDGTLRSVSNGLNDIPLSGGPAQVSKDPGGAEVKLLEEEGKVEAIYENGFQFTWTMRSTGLLDLDVMYQPKDQTYFAGISFNYPEEQIKKVKWMGDGPYRVWKNRRKGVTLDVWQKDYNNTITGHDGFVYPEFKGYYSNLYWVKLVSDESSFIVYNRSDAIYLRLFTPEEAPEPARTSIVHPKGDISFLHGIPAIGTKFKKPGQLGPQSSPYYFNAQKFAERGLKISLTFDFR